MPRFHRKNSSSQHSQAQTETLCSTGTGTETLRPSRTPGRPPFRDESLLELLNSPFNPDPTTYHDGIPQFPPPTPPMTFQTAYSSHQYSPILPMTPTPSRPVTTSAIPPDCFEESVIPPPYNNMTTLDLTRWGSATIVNFQPIHVSENQGTLGTPLRDCLTGFGLHDPEERLFQCLVDVRKSHFELIIMWPGYPDLDWVVPISIYGPDNFLITKRELAYRIAVQYQNFALMCELNQVKCDDPRWRIGRGGYTFDRMRLAMLHWLEGDLWIACISVLTDRDADPNGLRPMRDISRRGY